MFWVAIGVMLVAALLAVLWPLYRQENAISARAVGIGAMLISVSAVTYFAVGQPDARFAATAPNSVEDMVTSLAERLEANPADTEGWKMLGRSYLVMRRFPDAVAAFERAVTLENSSNGQTLADLGEAVFMNNNDTLQGRAGELFESSLALVPGNPKALFFSGLAAGNRGDTDLAAERWEALLATSPPPEIEDILRARIAEWRGEVPAVAAVAPETSLSIALNVTVGDLTGIAPDTTVFIIARDPAQPAPPIAVARRQFGELPASVMLSDADAMLPGRPLSGFERVEVIARVSPSGQPMAQTGDWFGTTVLELADAREATINIDQQVP